MDLENKTIDTWLENAPESAFRQEKRENYFSKYISLKDYLKDKVHNQVTIGAHLKEPDILINDHGVDHIETVIEKATDLLICKDCDFTAYEVYILLLCIQLHDVGNISGRYNHEMNVDNIIDQAVNLCGCDTVETMMIREIVKTHSGKIPGTENKDKISLLNPKENCLNGEVRTQAIASVLRFADELTDDKRRAFTKLLHDNQIPKKSEVYHAYASCLDSVYVKHGDKAIELTFKIPKIYATRTFGKMDKEILLLDEIYYRIMKMHLERIYCMRFLKRIIDINRISVSVDFYDNYLNILPQIKFEVCEKGYPLGSTDGLFSLCEPLKDMYGKKIDGKYIKNQIEKHDKKNIEVVSKPLLRPNSSIGGKISTAVTTIKAWCRGLKS